MAKKYNITPEKAREMLHNPPHGKPLTKKQRGLFGHIANANLGKKMPNYNESNVHLPENFHGDGYTSYNWVSPAWNGQFQFGGQLSGMTGNMYAREGAPSNGKYAKKTKPSAQNGADLYPVEYWKKQGLLSADTLQRGTMFKMPYIDQKKLYNTPIPKNVHPNDIGFMIAAPGQENPNLLAKRKKLQSFPTYDISGNIASINHPQGANVGTFNYGGEVSPYYQNGVDFKTKGMQDGGNLTSVEKLSLIKERNKKRDSVNISLTNQFPKDYNKVNLGMLQYFQNEPEKYKNIMKKKKGGVIKDDMGYWNPNNHGKVVEINSPNITMDGVNQPLLGVSNLGHTQMMYPNQEYQFQGDKVREYPLDEVTKSSKQDKGQLKKLRQLTDFSNNNNMEQAKDGKWIQKAINPKHKGYCTPMTKSTCTPKRKALAKTFKKHHGFHEDGGLIPYQDGGMPFSMSDVGPSGNLSKIDLNQGSSYGGYVGQSGINQGLVGNQSGNNFYNNKIKGNEYAIGQGIGAIGQGLQGGGMDNGPSASQQAVGKFGPLGSIISQASQIGTSFTKKSTSTGASALDTMVFDPAGSTWLNKDLSTQDRILGGLFQPYGAFAASKAKKAKKKQAEMINNLVQQAAKSVDVDANKPKRYVRPEDVAIDTNQMFPSQGTGTNYLSGENGISLQQGGVLNKIHESGKKLFQTDNPNSIFYSHPKESINWHMEHPYPTLYNIKNKLSKLFEEGGEIQNTFAPNTMYTNMGYEPLSDSNKIKNFRAGGHLSDINYISPSKESLQTYALGGELEVYKNGHAETISSNPYLPDGGETVMFRGPSHENGGIPISYGKNPVEVEGGEPAVKLQDGGTGKDNLVVFGNMKIPNYGVVEIGDKDAKNKKFKNYIADLSKKEEHQNKVVNKGLKIVNETDDNNAFDLLKMNSGKLLMKGGDMKLQEIAKKKQIAASVQDAILKTAEEYNLDSDALAKGNVKKAKNGTKMSSYQNGGMEASIFGNYAPKISRVIPASDSTTFLNSGYNWVPDNRNVMVNESTVNPKVPIGSPDFNEAFGKARKQGLKLFNWNGKTYTTDLAIPSKKTDYVGIQSSGEVSPKYTPFTAEGEVGLKPSHGNDNSHEDVSTPSKGKFDWMTLAGQVWPYFRPSNQIPLDPNQLTGEYYALSHNTLEPVSAQKYNPLLDQPYDISLQDQLNANQSDFNSIQRLVQNNPSALSVLAGQKYGANSHVLGEQFRANQANKAAIYSKNRDILNDAQLKNLAILDQQYVRQAQAKSNTKAIAQAAYSSIADKIAQNKLENRTLGVYENLYNYRYDNLGRAINMNSPAQFNIPQVSQKEIKKEHRNGAIVKAIKNM